MKIVDRTPENIDIKDTWCVFDLEYDRCKVPNQERSVSQQSAEPPPVQENTNVCAAAPQHYTPGTIKKIKTRDPNANQK